MEFNQAIKEFQEITWELERQYKLRTLRRILRIVLIGFFLGKGIDQRISELTTKKDLIVNSIKERMREELAGVRNRIKEIENSGTYLTYIDKERCSDEIEALEDDLNRCDENEVLEHGFISEKRKELEECLQIISNYNKNFVEQRKRKYSYLWNKGLLSLDDEQQTAIVTDDKYNLGVAAAGSGKTEALITRIAYLIARKPDGVQPKRILAIAYQRKAKEEIEQRLRDRFNIKNVNVRTFHKLGKNILEEIGKEFRRTDIIDENKKHEIIQMLFNHEIKNDPDFYKLFLQFVKTLHNKETKEDGKTKGEPLTYARERAYYSINNTRVNSQAEKEILDFFLSHKLDGKPVAVKYEPNVDGFRPDFYLPQYELFIEHWALNEKGEVPDWFSQSTKKYRESMEMKKKWFAKHDKLLVETFAYEYDEDDPDKFIELLKKRVIKKLQMRYDGKFEFTLKTYDEIVDIAWQAYRTPIDYIGNFITSAKTYGLTSSQIANRLQKIKWTRKQLAFGNLVLPLYSAYEELMKKNEKIDFEDMINSAIDALDHDQNLRAGVYDHILIDEYQDISAQRYKLIKKLLERNPKCRLFCIGDDWQSIMGFSGSNLNFFVNFDEYFENPAITKISTNYRSVKSIVDAGADLIKNNTSCQIQKSTLSNREEVRPIRVLKSPHKKEYERNYHHQTAEDCCSRIINYIQNGYAPRDILVLTRCMRTRVARGYRFLSNIGAFIERAKDNGIRIAYDNTETQKKVRLLTVHRSKGLEAKVVFLLNVIKDTYGFPCEIEDPSIYEPARENYPSQDQKEERRLLRCNDTCHGRLVHLHLGASKERVSSRN